VVGDGDGLLLQVGGLACGYRLEVIRRHDGNEAIGWRGR
jgi:hypothetical protein